MHASGRSPADGTAVAPLTTARRRSRAGVAALLVGAALVLGACSGGSTGPTAAPTSGPTTAAGGVGAPAGRGPTTSSATGSKGAPPVTAPTTTSITTTTTTTVPATTTTTAPALAAEPAGPLQSGSTGTRTMALQVSLKAMGYDPGPPDGSFGLKSTLAVWAFQALHGLPSDGVVSPAVEKLILARPAQAMLRPALGPTHTEVDLTRQVLLVFRDGRPTLITHVSSGSQHPYCEGTNCGDAVTPVGRYRYQRRIAGWRTAPLGRLYNPVYFTGGIAVHGATSVPLHPASHGCVRIPMHIAEYFPGLVANGDPIEVFRS
ncbi:MAG: Peptidoglycan-binding domain 1 protein [Acidimicrobiales bacterium]|nr:Peptidoglycan-binding domain 1 protein [Acidimicrobiales bacterium]